MWPGGNKKAGPIGKMIEACIVAQDSACTNRALRPLLRG